MSNELLYERKNGFDGIEPAVKKSIFDFCEDYRVAITLAKTEREFCDFSVEMLKKSGFVCLNEKEKLIPGDKVYSINRGKGVTAFVIGEEPIENGVNIIGAHIDSPRLDLKPNPLYEDGGMAYFKTHYYGGIRKYQWLNIPLSLHGVIVKKDGTKISVNIGEKEDDTVFCIADLLPHLAQNQAGKKLSEAFDAEKLNVIVGNIPIDTEKQSIKLAVLEMLNEKYGICETDFITSELELVPAYPARDLGFDRSMIAGYGHDDRVCAYAALRGILDVKVPKKTSVCLLVDKEEIGSMGNTGMQSRFFENNLAWICKKINGEYNELMLRDCLSNSACLSADVGAAYDSNYADVYEKSNAAFMNEGLLLTKYTGARGKSSASDANAEFMAKVCRIFEENGVKWQSAELGKTDIGGGGTIACFLANLDVEVIDVGVPLLAMHSPYEIAGKFDIYMAYQGYKAFYNN
jgi:aspartyl aminopeptidase